MNEQNEFLCKTHKERVLNAIKAFNNAQTGRKQYRRAIKGHSCKDGAPGGSERGVGRSLGVGGGIKSLWPEFSRPYV